MSRPPLPPDQRRDERVHVLMTAQERASLDARAEAHGLSLSDYLRRRGLAHPLPLATVEGRARAALTTALLRLGVNLNQIAHHMNAGRGAPPDLLELLADIRAHMDRLDDAGRDQDG